MYQPGKPLEELAVELEVRDVTELTKLASNENALGPSPLAIDVIRQEASRVHLYPDGGSLLLRKALAAHLELHEENIITANGSNECIELLARAFLFAGANVVVSEQAFLIYALIAQALQADVIRVPMRNFTHNLAAMAAAITPETGLVFVGNPNNPTGTMVSPDELCAFFEAVPAEVPVVVDEAYIELVPIKEQPQTLAHVRQRPNLFLLRTFSKAYGLAGLRVGYIVGPKESIGYINRIRQPFNVNTLAQIAARSALQDHQHLERTRTMVRKGYAFLTQSLERLGVEYVPSVTNFLLVNVGNARRTFEAMLKHRMIVRPMDAYGLKEYIRVTIGTDDENERFVSLLTSLTG